MGVLTHPARTESVTDAADIDALLKPLGVSLAQWSTSGHEDALRGTAALADEEKERVLLAFEDSFDALKVSMGYQARDLIVLHPEVKGLDDILAKFNRPHTHDDDEVRFVIDGEGVFGFVHPDGGQSRLLVQEGDYIKVPKGAEHWFELTDKRRIKAIRYFTDTSGWVPNYTDTKVERAA